MEWQKLTNIAKICILEVNERMAAMATMNVSLPDPLKAWVEAQAETGRYANASDYVRDLIRKDQDRANKLDALQRLITEGMESGEAKDLDLPSFLKGMRKTHESKSKK